MMAIFISTLVTFFVVIDPPGCAPIFASLTAGTSAAHRRAMATRSVGIAAIVLFLFALVGEAFLRAMGISLDAFRIAGGIMLFLIALEMVFEKRTQRRESRAAEVKDRAPEDISVFPMAIPMIAGPGSIATAMLVTSHREGPGELAVVLGALALILVVTLLALLAAGPIMRFFGTKVEAMITRLLGVILAALAAQFVIDGIKASLG
jgi:multiple antibiotic resistance protein